MGHPIDSVWKVIPGLSSSDIEATAKWYEEVLHFTVAEVGNKSGKPKPDFCSIFAGDKAVVNIYFTTPDGPKPTPGYITIAVGTEELDQLHETLTEDDRVRFDKRVEDTPWGWRWFTILDPDDNKLTFFKFLEGGNPGTEWT